MSITSKKSEIVCHKKEIKLSILSFWVLKLSDRFFIHPCLPQVEMECPLEGVNTSTTNWANGSSTTTATCGEKFDPPACFPFC